MSKHLLVVGGSGFIGRYLCEIALKMGYQVTSLSPNKVDLEKKIKKVLYLVGDISDYYSLVKVLGNKRFEFVVNLSGYIDHRTISQGGEHVIKMHFEGLRNLIKVINTTKLVRFIQIGTSDEYGGGFSPQKEIEREQPFSAYSFAKVASSYYVQMLNREEGFPGTVIRLFLVYGPNQGLSRFIPQVILGCLSDRKFNVSPGEQLRDFCYVADVANAILLALEVPNIDGEIINIGSGMPLKIKDVVQKINTIIGKGHPVYGGVDYRTGEKMALYPDVSKSISILNYQPKVSLDEGLIRTIESFS